MKNFLSSAGHTDSINDICREIKLYFRANGISYTDAATALGKQYTDVANALSGNRNFGRTRAELWASTFGFDPVYLRTGVGTLVPGIKPEDGDALENGTTEGADAGPVNYPELIASMSKTIDQLTRTINSISAENKQLHEELRRSSAAI